MHRPLRTAFCTGRSPADRHDGACSARRDTIDGRAGGTDGLGVDSGLLLASGLRVWGSKISCQKQ